MTDRKRTANEIKGLPEPENVSNSLITHFPIEVHRERGDDGVASGKRRTPKSETKTKESATRKRIDARLINLGWNTDEEDPGCNVTTERAKTERQNKRLKGNEPDYVLYKSGTTQVLGIIEAKQIGKNLDEALKEAIRKYAEPLEASVVFATDGTFVKSWHVGDGEGLSIGGEALRELVSEKTILKFLDEGHNIEAISEPVRHSREELIKTFEWSNNLLRKEGLRGLDRFVEFANILFLKLISEIEEEKEQRGERRILNEKYCWDSFARLKPEMMMDYLNDTVLRHLVARYNQTGDVFQETMQITNPNTLKEIVDRLSELTLINTESEIKGDAFEYFLKNLTKGNDLGEYFTPRHIVGIMTRLVNPQYGERIYDCCCGTGGFLIETFRHIKKSCRLTPETLDKLKNDTVFGIELTNTARIAKMNMILAGDGHTNIHQADSLAKPQKNKYDIVLTNFPFSQATDHGHLYGLDTNDGNVIFLKHIIDALNDGGRAGVISFQGVLYDSKPTYRNIREYLLEKCNLQAVIKLHNYVFRPYSAANTSILIFTKGVPTKKVWFFHVENDGFKKTTSLKGRSKIDDNDLELLEAIWSNREETEKSWWATIEEIRGNQYNLNAETYKPLRKSVSEYPFISLSDERFFEVVRGTEVGSDTYTKDEGVPFIRIGDLTGKGFKQVHTTASDCVMADEEDILFSFDGTIGVAGKGFKGAISAGIRKIRSKDETEILNDFLFFALQAEDVQRTMKRYSKTSTIIHAGSSFEHIRIPKPPLDIQREITRKLTKKDERINKIVALLDAFRGGTVDDSLFEFEDIQSRPLVELITNGPQNGLYKHKSSYGSGTPIIRIDNIYDGQLFIENIKRVRLTDEELNKYHLNAGEVVLNRVNSPEYIGKCCVYKGEYPECVFESNMMRLSVNPEVVIPEYVVYYLTSQSGKQQILTKMKRSVNQVSINHSDVKSLQIPVPSISDQEEIVQVVKREMETMHNLEGIRDRLKDEIRDEIDGLYD